VLRPRITPCLLVREGGLVKTVGFGDSKYVGDPLNAVRIFNEKEVDELVVLDIDATAQDREPDLKMIQDLAAECRMPLCYGGGVKSVEMARQIISVGVEKIALSSVAIEDPGIVGRIAEAIGSQSVVVVLDVKKERWGRGYRVYIRNGSVATGRTPAQILAAFPDDQIGEVMVNDIQRDGEMKGYDLDLAREVRQVVAGPMTVLGGAGSLDHIRELFGEFGVIAAAAGSLFVFKGPYRAVLINYPNSEEKSRLLAGLLDD
jgi:imidazole glycerol-phosphate synthase subunit HisF